MGAAVSVDVSSLRRDSDWSAVRVGVLGLGIAGYACADSLTFLGANVVALDERDSESLREKKKLLELLGARVELGQPLSLPADIDLLVVSPGLPPQHLVIEAALAAGIPVWGELELAWRLRDLDAPADWLCVTGTNGKTTTTQLTTAMLQAGGHRAASCGNIGTPILDCIRDPEGFDFLVVEISSFQLHYLGDVSPIASTVLNIDHDHIDWHGTFDAYKAAKGKVFANTKVAGIYNAGDATTIKLLEDADVVEGCRAIGFTVGVPRVSEVGYSEDILCDRAFLENRKDEALELATLEDLGLIGVLTPHLLANVAAASALARACDVEPAAIRSAIRDFRLDKHRIELVAEHAGITWIDDSKATNPHATAASLSSFDSVVWIVGGLLKGVDITPLVERFAKKLRGAVVIGKERDAVLAALASVAPEIPVIEINVEENSQVMPHAVEAASNLAQAGDTVLLAPSSASMDQFKDYADRGNQFAQAVRNLIGQADG